MMYRRQIIRYHIYLFDVYAKLHQDLIIDTENCAWESCKVSIHVINQLKGVPKIQGTLSLSKVFCIISTNIWHQIVDSFSGFLNLYYGRKVVLHRHRNYMYGGWGGSWPSPIKHVCITHWKWIKSGGMEGLRLEPPNLNSAIIEHLASLQARMGRPLNKILPMFENDWFGAKLPNLMPANVTIHMV